ncbi:MAG TPA: asparagine synthase (glutamine-hydrolyzing) [Anaeromyxobacteraceae bacterium]|jgi:asparagine synthase (glutamine-hydrolysing)|nr:asparagine synthase (glutamine-hydrolyzing) [Anaeromyxobacteraceae bacterium]
MCGIAGSFLHPLVPPDGVPPGMARALAHRGPDHFGAWQEGPAALLHWRLSIIDLSPAGAQPMVSSDGRYVICFNGEIYNFEELRQAVDRASATRRGWRGHSDTEVLLEGFALWGTELLGRLNGMFALALYDRERQVLHLARDRAGIKPLYCWEHDGGLLFASEAKFFFQAPGFDPPVDAAGLAAFFTYAHCHGDAHVLGGVRQLSPGELLTCAVPAGGGPLELTRQRFCPAPERRPRHRSDEEAARDLRAILTAAVGRQLVADVPVGVLLSGGVDSSILSALAAERMGPESTMAFTLGYPGMGADFDEIDHARRVARHLGVRHFVCEATRDDLISDIERLVWHYDEPFADAAALNVFLLSRMIRSQVTVALAGEGSDELFGGYRRYQLEQALRRLGPVGRALCFVAATAGLDRLGFLPRRGAVLLRAMARKGSAARYSSYLQGELPIDLILKSEWCRPLPVHPAIESGYPDAPDSDPVGRLCLVDQQFWLPTTYLEKSDKGAMAHGLEIRVPFLDNEVVAFANSLPDRQRIRGGSRKWILKEAFRERLPAEVFQRFKRGFGVPMGRWLRRELRDYYAEQVLSHGSRVATYLRMDTVERCFREHVRGARDYSGLLWESLVLEVWLRHRERRFERDVSGSPASQVPSAPGDSVRLRVPAA